MFMRSTGYEIIAILEFVQILQYVPAMILITGDRVTAIILNVKYRVIFTVQKAK